MVSYTVNSGAAQTVTLNAQGSATVSTGVLTSNATYTLTGVAITTSPFCSQILNSSVTITVENAPVITFTSDVTSGCAPLRVNFTNTTLN
jgi:PKD repeat protein